MVIAKMKRNKTIKTSLCEGVAFLDRCVTVSEPQHDLKGVLDHTILGNMFEVCPLLPPNSIDLIVVDPPYNLTKNFNDTIFFKKNLRGIRGLHASLVDRTQAFAEKDRFHLCLL